MKILVLTGSPHANGTTAFLAGEFCGGAEAAGHQAVRFDTGRLNIHPCTGCNHCRKNDGKCIFDDDMTKIYPHLPESDAVVLVSPLYYFGITAQLKSAIDRFYAVNSKLRSTPKKLYLIAAGADTDAWAMDGVKSHYETMCRYLGWQEGGELLALGLATREDAKGSKYAEMARKFGNDI